MAPWIIAEKNGKVICGHFTCVAGLGESCTHIVAILFWTEIKVKFISFQPITDRVSYWLAPKDVRKMVPQPRYKTDFTSAKTKKRLADQSFENLPLSHCHSKKVTKVNECTKEEKLSFFKSLVDSNNPAAILRVLPKYSENSIPHTLTSPDVPLILTEVFNEKYTKFNYGQLLIESEKFFNEMINVTSRQVEYVLEQTKGQANSNLWV